MGECALPPRVEPRRPWENPIAPPGAQARGGQRRRKYSQPAGRSRRHFRRPVHMLEYGNRVLAFNDRKYEFWIGQPREIAPPLREFVHARENGHGRQRCRLASQAAGVGRMKINPARALAAGRDLKTLMPRFHAPPSLTFTLNQSCYSINLTPREGKKEYLFHTLAVINDNRIKNDWFKRRRSK
jgi:hypothetical protein